MKDKQCRGCNRGKRPTLTTPAKSPSEHSFDLFPSRQTVVREESSSGVQRRFEAVLRGPNFPQPSRRRGFVLRRFHGRAAHLFNPPGEAATIAVVVVGGKMPTPLLGDRLDGAIQIQESDAEKSCKGRTKTAGFAAVRGNCNGYHVEHVPSDATPQPRPRIACGEDADASRDFAKAKPSQEIVLAVHAGSATDLSRREQFRQAQSDREVAKATHELLHRDLRLGRLNFMRVTPA